MTTANYLSPLEVAAELGMHSDSIYGFINNNELRAIKLGHALRISRKDLDDFIAKNIVAPIQNS